MKTFEDAGKSKSSVQKFMKLWQINFNALQEDADQAQRILEHTSREVAAHFSLNSIRNMLSRGIPVTKKRHALVG